jgi:hypothetical protein
MLRFVARALAACASIAAITLLASTASADLPLHPALQTVEPNADDAGPDPDNPQNSHFGAAVMIRDELAFIGMPRRFPGGRVAVYAASSTALVRTATLVPSTSVTGGEFGRALTFRDGILVVGARQAAYVFQRSNGVWTQRQKITPPAADSVLVFAQALRYENGTLAIGARRDNLPGAVYIYERDTTTGKFIARGKLVSPDSALFDEFGTSISTGGQAMVIGAPGTGAAYIFRRNSAGVWRHNQKLVPSDQPDGRSRFGTAVAIDRQMIIVGAPFAGEDIAQPTGAAYVFTPGAGIYVETLKLDPQPERAREEHVLFGLQIAMFDQRIVIGAQRVFTDGPLSGFAGFSYTRSGSSLLPRGLMLDGFASESLSLANQRVLVGVPCRSESGFCPGTATLYNLTVFE